MTLTEALAGLPPCESEWDGRVSLGLPDAALTLDALAEGGTALDALVAAKRNGVKGGDDKLGCAYLTGELSWTLGKLLGGLWLTGWHVQYANPATIAITLRPVSWVENGDCRISQVIDLHIDPSGLTCGSDDPQHLARAMVDLHQGVITALSRSTGLGQAAQWRLVGTGFRGRCWKAEKPWAVCRARLIWVGRFWRTGLRGFRPHKPNSLRSICRVRHFRIRSTPAIGSSFVAAAAVFTRRKMESTAQHACCGNAKTRSPGCRPISVSLRLLNIVQIDSTPADIILVDSFGRKPTGRPWRSTSPRAW
jgi:hypothetical protein